MSNTPQEELRGRAKIDAMYRAGKKGTGNLWNALRNPIVDIQQAPDLAGQDWEILLQGIENRETALVRHVLLQENHADPDLKHIFRQAFRSVECNGALLSAFTQNSWQGSVVMHPGKPKNSHTQDMSKITYAPGQDAVGLDPERGIYVVADGIGSTRAAALASRTAVHEILHAKTPLLEGPQNAHAKLSRETVLAGTTIAAAEVSGSGSVTFTNMGDSPIFRLKENGTLEQLTKDHSHRNRLTRWLGNGEDEHGVVALPAMHEQDSGTVDLLPGEHLILATDGVPDTFGNHELLQNMFRNVLHKEQIPAVRAAHVIGEMILHRMLKAVYRKRLPEHIAAAHHNDNFSLMILQYKG